MYSKTVFFLLVLSVAQQGFGASALPSKDLVVSYDVYDVIEGAAQIIPYIGMPTGLTRGLDYCKQVIQSVGSQFISAIENLRGLATDLGDAVNDYKSCAAKPENEIKTCKENVRNNYLQSIKVRFQNVGQNLKGAVLSIVKIPTCIFNNGSH